jgi:hypothetical protein
MHPILLWSVVQGVIIFATSTTSLAQPSSKPGSSGSPPASLDQSVDPSRGKFVRVTPVPPNTDGASSVAVLKSTRAGELRIGQGRFFSFALPPSWRVGEDGQYALTLLAPDNKALTIMVGVAGMPVNYPPARFAYEKLSTMRVQNLQMGATRQARPVAGFSQAVEFDVSYVSGGIAHLGVTKVSIAPAYDTATMAMTAALSTANQWGGYSSWLPQVADQVSALNGAAFGARGDMQQNLRNSVAFGEAARQYRDWSQKNWQQLTDQRNASQDRQNVAIRENLGGVQTFASPFGTSPKVELPTTYKYYWTDRQGQYVGTNDPSANPNVGSTGEWRKMDRVGNK